MLLSTPKCNIADPYGYNIYVRHEQEADKSITYFLNGSYGDHIIDWEPLPGGDFDNILLSCKEDGEAIECGSILN